MYLDEVIKLMTSGVINADVFPEKLEEYEEIRQFIQRTGLGQAFPGYCRLVGVEGSGISVALTVSEPVDYC